MPERQCVRHFFLLSVTDYDDRDPLVWEHAKALIERRIPNLIPCHSGPPIEIEVLEIAPGAMRQATELLKLTKSEDAKEEVCHPAGMATGEDSRTD